MALQEGCGGVIFCTKATLMEELRVQLANVLLEVTGLREGTGTVVAGEAAPLVDALMALLVSDGGELLATIFTNEWPCTCNSQTSCFLLV